MREEKKAEEQRLAEVARDNLMKSGLEDKTEGEVGQSTLNSARPDVKQSSPSRCQV